MILFCHYLEIYSYINFLVLLHITKLLLLNICVFIVYICMKWSKSESHSVASNSLQPHGLCSPWNSPGQNTGVGRLSLLQGIFQPRDRTEVLPHCRRILYQLSHKRSPYMSIYAYIYIYVCIYKYVYI